MKKPIFFIVIFFITFSAFCCECAEYIKLSDQDKESFINSNNVVIAEVIKEGNEFTLFIIKQLKGVINQDTIHGTSLDKNGSLIDNCTYYPTEKGKYLLFLFKNDDLNKITLSQCDSNRNLKMTDLSYSVPDSYSIKQLKKITKKFIKEKTKLKDS